MSTIRPVELDMVDLVFRGGERGYILNFSNRTFGEFFALELDVDIDAEIYKREGTSKGKRLRGFLTIVDDGTAAKTLRLLWDYRDAMLKGFNQDDPQPVAKKQVFAVVARLEGTATGIPTGLVPAPKLSIHEWRASAPAPGRSGFPSPCLRDVLRLRRPASWRRAEGHPD